MDKDKIVEQGSLPLFISFPCKVVFDTIITVLGIVLYTVVDKLIAIIYKRDRGPANLRLIRGLAIDSDPSQFFKRRGSGISQQLRHVSF